MSVLKYENPGTFQDRLTPGRYFTTSASGAQLNPSIGRRSRSSPAPAVLSVNDRRLR